MWHNLALIALKDHNLALAERCASALGNVATAQYLNETLEISKNYKEKHNEDTTEPPEVWARLSILAGDLNTAENIYLEQGDIERALDMYKKLHKWDEALRLAEQRGYRKLKELKDEQMALLLQTNQHEKVGDVLEKEGKIEQALNMYLRSNKLLKVPGLMLKNPELMKDQNLIAVVLKSLIKQEMFEAAAEIYDRLVVVCI